jgi:hypothetical protein
MIPMRQSPAVAPNALLVADPPTTRPATARRAAARASGQGNVAWLRRTRKERGIGEAGDVVLIGGSSVVDFRVRVAQSHARHDLTPSYWSAVGLMADATRMFSAPLSSGTDPSLVPATNAITTLALSDYDDPERYPNIAILRFPGAATPVLDAIPRLRTQRSIADLPALVVAWLGFVWGTGGSSNPLLDGLGLPSAVLVETLYGLVDVELTPGLASASSCPEAIWQSVKWWHDFYTQAVAGRPEGTPPSADTAPWGHYRIRQPEASYLEPTPPAR